MTTVPPVATDEIAILGCGLMGSALARTLARHGTSVVAWNRTHERAEALTADGVLAVRDLAEAADCARVVIACLNSYRVTQMMLGEISDWRGRVVVNLASGTPAEAEALEQWFHERGAHYVDGSIFCYPEDIGGEDALLAYAGSASAWKAAQPVLELLGSRPLYVGDAVGGANILLMGGSIFYLPAMVACTEMATYLGSSGVAPELGLRVMQMFCRNLITATNEIQAAIASGDHGSDRATIDTYAEVEGPIAEELGRAAQQAPVLTAATRLLSEAVRSGLGGLGPSALTNLLVRPGADAPQ